MRNRRRIQRRGPLIVYGKDEVSNFLQSKITTCEYKYNNHVSKEYVKHSATFPVLIS